MANEDDIADRFNQIFQLELDWNDSKQIQASPKSVEEFATLAEQILPMIRLREVQNAIWTLTQNRSLLPLALKDEDFMRSLRLTGEERDSVKQKLSDPNGIVFLEKGQDFEKELTREDVERLLEIFYPQERDLLREAGLNQSSIAVIISKLRQCEEDIKRNVLRSKSILTGKYVDATNVLHRYIERLRERNLAAAPDVRRGDARVVSPMTLLHSKEKLIGLATLWGNAVPLIVSRDWGIASVISATAGATVAAVLPSGQRDRNLATRKSHRPKRSSSAS